MKKIISTLTLLCLGFVAFADDLTFIVVNTTTGFSTGAIDMNVSGGVGPYTYSWSGPGGFTSNSEDISGLAIGTYTVTVTDLYCGVATTTVFVDASAGIDEKENGVAFSVFPNPAKDQVTIMSEELLNGAGAKLINIEGKVLEEKQKLSGNTIIFELTKCAPGFYFVELTNAGKTSRKKIMKE